MEFSSIPPNSYNGIVHSINFTTQIENNKIIIKCNDCAFECNQEDVLKINEHAKTHAALYEQKINDKFNGTIVKTLGCLYYTFRNQNILYFVCINCDSCSKRFDTFMKHYCTVKKSVFLTSVSKKIKK